MEKIIDSELASVDVNLCIVAKTQPAMKSMP